jgi:hypothetical protein
VRDDCLAFYWRWGLERLLTWEYPVPIEADLAGGMHEPPSQFREEAGLTIFVPWYILRGKRIDLEEAIRLPRAMMVPAHLRKWVFPAKKKGDEWGDIRYAKLVWLYRVFELGLRRRYEAACRKNLERLDAAFASVLKRDADSVRKLRLELSRGLRPGPSG